MAEGCMHTEVNIRHGIANTHGGAGRGVEAGGRGAREAWEGGGNTTGKHHGEWWLRVGCDKIKLESWGGP